MALALAVALALAKALAIMAVSRKPALFNELRVLRSEI